MQNAVNLNKCKQCSLEIDLGRGITTGIRRQFFSVRVGKHWNRLNWELVDALSLEVLRSGWMGL